ncbi:MAG: hypothetical protein ACLPX5_01645 [Dissulfurispiraceae bacterium]
MKQGGKPTLLMEWKAAVLTVRRQAAGHHRGLRAGHARKGITR